MYGIIRYVKPLPPMLFNSHIYTSLGVFMRSPFKGGLWIGWTEEESERHLKSVRELSSYKK
jgi:hypothetical protein